MWPKVFAQLVELLPHVTRLIPMADLFFSSQSASRAAGDKAAESTLASINNDVRASLGQVTAAHEGLYRQLQGQGVQIAELAAGLALSRIALDNFSERTTRLEQHTATLTVWVKTAVALLAVTLAVVVVVLYRTL